MRVYTSRKSTTGSVDEVNCLLFCNKIAPVVYISRPVASGQLEKSYEQEQKFPDWEKMEGVCVKTGLEKIVMK